jgi:ADP-ribosylglycohydrolase
VIAVRRPGADAPADRVSVSEALLARAEAAYLGLALGDALGATVEFMTPREIVHHFGVHREIVGGGWLKLKPGQVTDDTTMSLALGEAILANGGNVVPARLRARPSTPGCVASRSTSATPCAAT